MLESMIVELNVGEALPSLKQKGWERVGADGGAPYNLCEKIAKRMKSGKELVGSSFPEIYSTYFAFQSALELGMEDAVRQWRGIVALALLQDEYPFEMRTLPLNGTHKGAMQADFTEIGRAYAPVGEDFFLPRDPEHGDTVPSGLMVGYFDGAPRFAFSRRLLAFPAAVRPDPKGDQAVPWFNYAQGLFRDPSEINLPVLQRDVLISRLEGVLKMTSVPNSPIEGQRLIAHLTENFMNDLLRTELEAKQEMRTSDAKRNLWQITAQGYFLGTYYADMGMSVQTGDRSNTLDSACRRVALLNTVMAVAGLPQSIRGICPKGVYLYYNGRSIAFLDNEWFWVPLGGVADSALVNLNMTLNYQLDPSQQQYAYNCDIINKMLGMLSHVPTLDIQCQNLIQAAYMPVVSNLSLPDTLVDLDSPPPVEIPLPAPFDGVINPVTALPFERSDDLVADSLYKFNRSEMSSFNLTDNVNPDIIKNVNFSAIRNEVGQIVDHAVPPVGDRMMQLEVAGEVKILDVKMTARDYGDVTVDITVESKAAGFEGRRYIVRKAMPETRIVVSDDMALSDLVIWPNVPPHMWHRYYTYFKQNNSLSDNKLLEMVAVGQGKEVAATRITQQVVTPSGLAPNTWQIASTSFFPTIVAFRVNLPAGKATVGCFFADDGKFAKQSVVMAKTANIGLDFGTSNTIAAMEIDGHYQTVRLEDAVCLHKHILRDTETESNMLREFICDGQLKTMSGISTALEVTNGAAFSQMTEEGVQKTQILIDGHICHSTRDFTEQDAIVTGLKWGDGTGLTPTHKAAMRLFLRQVMLQYALIAAINQGTKINWRATFPNTASFDVAGFQACIKESAEWVAEETGIELGTVELFTESQAAGAYFIAAGATALSDGFLCADVGGGSTDVSLWLDDMHKPQREFSVVIGGRNILTEAIYHGFLRSKQRGEANCPEEEFLKHAAGANAAAPNDTLKAIAQKDLARVNMLREMAARQAGSADNMPQAFSLIVDLMCANHSAELMAQFSHGGSACPSVYESIRFNFASIIYLIAENARRFTQTTGRALNKGGLLRLFFAGNGGRLYKWLTQEDQALVRQVFDLVYGVATSADAVQMCAMPKTEVALGVHKLDASLACGAAAAAPHAAAAAVAAPFGVTPAVTIVHAPAAEQPQEAQPAIEVPSRQDRVLEFLAVYEYLTKAPWLAPYINENGQCADRMTITGKLNAFDSGVSDEVALSECFKHVFNVWYWGGHV